LIENKRENRRRWSEESPVCGSQTAADFQCMSDLFRDPVSQPQPVKVLIRCLAQVQRIATNQSLIRLTEFVNERRRHVAAWNKDEEEEKRSTSELGCNSNPIAFKIREKRRQKRSKKEV
jgi:hypothetical protein